MRLRTGSMERMGVRRCELGLGLECVFQSLDKILESIGEHVYRWRRKTVSEDAD